MDRGNCYASEDGRDVVLVEEGEPKLLMTTTVPLVGVPVHLATFVASLTPDERDLAKELLSQ